MLNEHLKVKVDKYNIKGNILYFSPTCEYNIPSQTFNIQIWVNNRLISLGKKIKFWVFK